MARQRSVDGEVRAVGRGGEAVVQTEQGVVLVPGALPGERVEVLPTKARRGVTRGRLGRLVDASPERRKPPCPYVSRCGGCPLMIASAGLQQEIKLGFLEEACRGLPGAAEVSIEWAESPLDLGYRQRARLAWHEGLIGYRSARSRRIEDIDRCLVLAPPLLAGLEEARRVLSPHLRGTGELQLQRTASSRAAIRLDADGEASPALFAACEELSALEPVAGVALAVRDAGSPAIYGEQSVSVDAGHEELLQAPYGAFAQANAEINRRLVDAVLELAAPDGLRVLELHAGIGNFTVRLAARAKSVVAVERNREAAAACRENLASRRLRARLVVADAERPPSGRYDVVVLDPPRTGCRAAFEGEGAIASAKRIVYVSCDTATLARDLRLAVAHGFVLDRAIAFDMFPHTAHVESVVLLVRT